MFKLEPIRPMDSHGRMNLELNKGDNYKMEEKIRARIKWNITKVQESLANAEYHANDNSTGGIIGSLLDEDRRILETIQLAKTLREFGGGQ